MLEHQKIILLNVKGQIELFSKELEKTLRWIHPSEEEELRNWLFDNFEKDELKVILQIFPLEAA